MSTLESMPLEPVLRAEALEWYRQKYPHRQTPEAEILKLYLKIKEYAHNDPLLVAYYRANRIAV